MNEEQRADLFAETKMLLEQCHANVAKLGAAPVKWPKQFVYRGIVQLLTKTLEMMNGLDEFEEP